MFQEKIEKQMKWKHIHVSFFSPDFSLNYHMKCCENVIIKKQSQIKNV